MMLQVIETSEDGRVLSIRKCNGADSALGYVASRLTHPEEDYAAAYDVISEMWSEYLHAEDGFNLSDVVFGRRGYSSRFGMACES